MFFIACYKPLRRWQHPSYDDVVSITPADCTVWKDYPNINPMIHSQLIPCGQCRGCRLEYSRQWAIRCMLEARLSENNIFLTLTYDDEHLVPAPHRYKLDDGTVKEVDPEIPIVVDENGEVHRDMSGVQCTLVPRDLQLFLKSLRKAWHKKGYDRVRFYACGEYGSLRYRPHYHVILFNCPVDDMELDLDAKSQCDFPQWKSAEIEKIWGKGRIRFSAVTFETCAYTARYMMKKLKGKEAADIYFMAGLEPEFCRMSLKPGIGRDFYELKKDILVNDDQVIIPGKGGIATVVHSPKYYDRLFDIDFPEAREKRVLRRKMAATNSTRLKRLRSDLSDQDQRDVEERSLARRTKNLDLQF